MVKRQEPLALISSVFHVQIFLSGSTNTQAQNPAMHGCELDQAIVLASGNEYKLLLFFYAENVVLCILIIFTIDAVVKAFRSPV